MIRKDPETGRRAVQTDNFTLHKDYSASYLISESVNSLSKLTMGLGVGLRVALCCCR